jgi:hypothetical protein
MRVRLLFNELLVNQVVLSGWHDSKDQNGEARILSAILRIESFKAFSDGGELQWIKDPELLDKISEAYFMIRSVSQMSDKYYGMLMVDWEQFSIFTMKNIYSYLEKSVEESKEAIHNALKEISSQVDNTPSY